MEMVHRRLVWRWIEALETARTHAENADNLYMRSRADSITERKACARCVKWECKYLEIRNRLEKFLLKGEL